MNATFILLEMRRITRDWVGLFFIAVLPAFFFLIFGATLDAKDMTIGNGNIAMYVLISMACYGAATATTSIGGQAAIERMQGWGRQLGLTPFKDSAYVRTKALIAMAVAAIPILLTFVLGVLLGAKGSTRAWLLSAVICLVGAAVFAVYGILVGSRL